MPNYVLVDAEQLDADLTKVADKIREKGGTSENLVFPDGYESAVDAISTGVTVQRKSGTFTTSSNGTATVDCGFKPDLVMIHKNEKYEGCPLNVAAAFNEDTRTGSFNMGLWSANEDCVYDVYFSQTSTGFSVKVIKDDLEWNESTAKVSFNYVAVKYT